MPSEIDPKERKRKASREFARRNRGKLNREARERKRRLVIDAKTGPCAKCGEELPPECMHLDHVRGEKSFTIGSWWASVGMGKLKAEIAKCDRLCPNCHARKHHYERQGVSPKSSDKTYPEKGRSKRNKNQ